MPFSPAAQAALIKWVNTFPVSTPAESILDLADGITLSQVLHDLDPTFDVLELDGNETSSRSLTQKRNLQSVYKGLFKYMRREAPECVPLVKVADFRAVAENPDATGLSQLVAVFLATSIFNLNEEHRHGFLVKLQKGGFGPADQLEIRRVVEEKQSQMKELVEAASLDDARDRDADLEDEEERLKLIAELEKKVRELDTATKRYADLNTRHSYLQESHDELKAKLAEVEGELDDLKKLHGADESQRVQALQRKIEEQATLIAGQEEEIDAYQTRQRQLEVEVERYKSSSNESQEYKDRYDELHHQMQDLERRANAADRYKQKLAAQRNLEQEVASLQYELESRKELDDKLKRALIEKERLHATEKEMLAAMTTIEQSLNDERDRKDHYRELYDELRAEYAQLEHQNTVNEKYIEEVKEMGAGGDLSGSLSPSASGEASLGNLEQELQQTTNDLSKVKLLEAEIEVLRHGAASSAHSDDLRRELDRMKMERDIAMKKYEAIFEKNGVAQEQIDALIQNTTGEGHLAFKNMRESNQKTQQELDELRTKHRKLEEAVKDKDRDMLAMKTDLDAVGEERLDGLERLKQSDQLIAASLRSELENLRSRYSSLEIENNMHKGQLLEALVAKEKLSKESPEISGAPPGVDLATYEETLKNYKSKSDKLRERVKQQKEQLEKQDQERYELQKRVKALESGSALAAQKAAHEQIIKNLQRENSMISTAWYDLTSRLQSNHVVLQRKDQPKSWINKQRQMVNGMRFCSFYKPREAE
ncbi:hypothetical protein BD289DRAFT_453226 [Coniella lustricola]|uniref:HOOK N-terminal domain-containing protein n=1 Tax=Coniella lustricola TaxID=2025994 RepID=A0A2T3A8B8_9PEZI|nr:hypothetical protein BD289DRAFT_453226 [Coniella lustricola]